MSRRRTSWRHRHRQEQQAQVALEFSWARPQSENPDMPVTPPSPEPARIISAELGPGRDRWAAALRETRLRENQEIVADEDDLTPRTAWEGAHRTDVQRAAASQRDLDRAAQFQAQEHKVRQRLAENRLWRHRHQTLTDMLRVSEMDLPASQVVLPRPETRSRPLRGAVSRPLPSTVQQQGGMPSWTWDAWPEQLDFAPTPPGPPGARTTWQRFTQPIWQTGQYVGGALHQTATGVSRDAGRWIATQTATGRAAVRIGGAVMVGGGAAMQAGAAVGQGVRGAAQRVGAFLAQPVWGGGAALPPGGPPAGPAAGGAPAGPPGQPGGGRAGAAAARANVAGKATGIKRWTHHGGRERMWSRAARIAMVRATVGRDIGWVGMARGLGMVALARMPNITLPLAIPTVLENLVVPAALAVDTVLGGQPDPDGTNILGTIAWSMADVQNVVGAAFDAVGETDRRRRAEIMLGLVRPGGFGGFIPDAALTIATGGAAIVGQTDAVMDRYAMEFELEKNVKNLKQAVQRPIDFAMTRSLTKAALMAPGS